MDVMTGRHNEGNSVAAVVVTYNRDAMLHKCVRSLLRQDSPCDIIVVDNGGTGSAGRMLRESFPGMAGQGRILYCRTGRNLGGAGGFSEGVRIALGRGYRYLWLMDDDVAASRTALSRLLEAGAMLCGDYGFLSCEAYWTDRTLCRMNRQHLTLTKRYCGGGDAPQRVMMATFVGLFLKAEVARKAGLPAADFFIWADDLEYTRRISMKWPCYAVPGSRVLHMTGSNGKVGIENEPRERFWRYRYLYRNEVYLYRREGARGMAFLSARMLLHSLRVILKAPGRKMERLRIIWGSFIKGFSFRPEVRHAG